MLNPIKIDSFQDLHLCIKTLGYPNNGESLMVSLMDKQKELYNIFIDNYEYNDYQHWLAHLPKETRIDAFIWTHPDEDHSIGVDKLLSAFDPEKQANIYLPTSLTRELLVNNKKDASLACYDYLKENYNKGRVYRWNEISLTDEEGIRYLCGRKIINRENGDCVVFRIGFMLPNSSVVNRRVDKSYMNAGEMNDLSLFFVIELNKARYIFTGDLADISLKFLDEDYLSNCRFIKIPHHGSKDPIHLVDKIKPHPSSSPYAVTTIYGTTNPYDEVIDKYFEKCEAVYSTDRGKEIFGLVEIDFFVSNFEKSQVTLSGNAKMLRPIVR